MRFMPAFDNALLGSQDRTRIIAESDAVAAEAEQLCAFTGISGAEFEEGI